MGRGPGLSRRVRLDAHARCSCGASRTLQCRPAYLHRTCFGQPSVKQHPMQAAPCWPGGGWGGKARYPAHNVVCVDAPSVPLPLSRPPLPRARVVGPGRVCAPRQVVDLADNHDLVSSDSTGFRVHGRMANERVLAVSFLSRSLVNHTWASLLSTTRLQFKHLLDTYSPTTPPSAPHLLSSLDPSPLVHLSFSTAQLADTNSTRSCRIQSTTRP